MTPEEQNPKLLSPLTLAFVGDGVYELLVRKKIVETGNMPPKKLNARKVEMVRASAQAAVYDGLEPLLEEEEREVLKRGRNAHTGSVPKNAQMADYHKATGVEALFGFLYLKGDWERLYFLFDKAMWIFRERVEQE
ncbi:MAG: ribonuclease III [Oscillospiraceae bacterium]|nr:ribonuclease III [Oscillospiraceae bacterium]MDD5920900.1 ribonuclease III domain-containing protein [Oscillospiraceae bacterium]HAG56473.1 ribonuclease III [Oscillospiraceae bacterium]